MKSIILNVDKNPKSSKYFWLFNWKKGLKKIPRNAFNYSIQQYVCNVHSSTKMLKEKQKKTKKIIKLQLEMKKITEKSS